MFEQILWPGLRPNSESRRHLPQLLFPREDAEPIPDIYLQMLYRNDWSWMGYGGELWTLQVEPDSLEEGPEHIEERILQEIADIIDRYVQERNQSPQH